MDRYHLSSAWLSLVVALGCTNSHAAPVDAGPPPCPSHSCDGPTPVDLLIVVEVADYADAPNGIVAGGLQALLEPLADGGDIASVHVGIVYSDMGGGEYLGLGCLPGDGYDGVLQHPRDERESSCATSPETYQVVESPADVEAASTALRCSLLPGLDHCVASSLEAMLKALTPSSSAVDFRGEAGGNGDTANAGFLRDDALLAILFVGTHDDCSLNDLRYIDSDAPRCPDGRVCCEERLLDVDRYLDGLAALGRRRIVVNAITGIPRDAVPSPGDTAGIGALLDRPEMMRPGEPLCVGGGIEDAWPAPRITRLAAACPGVVRSACDPSLFDDGAGPTMAEIGRFIARQACHPE